MPEDTTTNSAEATPAPVEEKPVETPPVEVKKKFTLEKVDAENVKKVDSRPDVTIINIPNLQKQKEEVEDMIGKLQTQLDQINEVLFEYAKLP